uniref:HAT C-terminal dimerisation domain-containing protein n=1 Tax=Solanum lycopersicum TaxID=4081 RepID=A0A3Q7JFE8_SOLLC
MWWKVNEPRFPILAEMVRDVLAIPISSVASECAFSTGGRSLLKNPNTNPEDFFKLHFPVEMVLWVTGFFVVVALEIQSDSIRLLGFDNKWVCIEDSIRLLLRNGFVISHLLDGNEMGSDQNSL